LIDYLQESGQLDNTLVMYCADNGASGEGSPEGSVNENKFFNAYPDDIKENLAMMENWDQPKPIIIFQPGGRLHFPLHSGCSNVIPVIQEEQRIH
jgi:arylsulfatase A-like enzyme